MTLGLQKATADVSLAEVSERARVSVQTVLRHFGSRDALIDQAIAYGAERIAAERRPASDDLATTIAALFDHYEQWGDSVILLLAQESTDPRIAQITASGRRVHRQWVMDLLAVWAAAPVGEDLVDRLIVLTDVYVWKILRRDMTLARKVAEDRVLGMVEVMLRADRSGGEHS